MTFTYRIKYYKNEEGEYTTAAHCDSVVISELIEKHWTKITEPIELELIAISNSEGQSIILEHAAKEVFETYYVPQNKSFHYHKKSGLALIQAVIDSFFANDIVWLESNLNKTNFENRRIRGDFFSKSFSYEFSDKPLSISWLCVFFGIGYVLTFGFLFLEFKGQPGFVFLMIFLLLIGVYYIIPSLLLHLQYRTANKDLIIWISKAEDSFVIKSNGLKKQFCKSDIKQVTKYENPVHKAPWSGYGYTEVEFKSGEIINLTNLLIDQYSINEKFLGHYIDFAEKKTVMPGIQRKMFIKF